MIASSFQSDGVQVDVYADDVSGELTEVRFINTTGQSAKIKIVNGSWSWEQTSNTTENFSIPAGHYEDDVKISFNMLD